MRPILAIAAAALVLTYASTDAFARGGGHASGSGHVNASSHYTHGYFRSNGTYVDGYHATNPNGTAADNYSTRGNVNPWTGQSGTH